MHVGFLGLLHVDHLQQMDGQHCHLVQKGDGYENALPTTHVSYSYHYNLILTLKQI